MPIPVIARTQSAELLGAVLDGAQLRGALLRNTQRMWVHQPYAKAPARRAQPALVFRKIVAPVQPGHAPGVAFVEGRGECLFAGLVTTALTRKDRDRRDPARKKFRGASFDPKHCPSHSR
jgi:hypothetical protein